ncbi:MAG: glycosyltransferase family 4 protein [Acidimicrobiales bacterium]
MSQYWWPETFPVNCLATALTADDIDIEVLTGHPNYPDGKAFPGYRAGRLMKQEHDGITIHRVPILPRGKSSGLRLAFNYLSFVVSASFLGPLILRHSRFDVVLVYAPSPITQVFPGWVLAKVKGAPLATWIQDLWPESLASTGHVRAPRVLALVGYLVSWLYRKNDMLLVQSPSFTDDVRRRAGSVPIAYLPNPAEHQETTQSADNAPALMLPPGFNVVFAGNLGRAQSLETVLDAAGRLNERQDIRFILVGSGSKARWLRDEVQRQGLTNIDLPGRFHSSAIPGILKQASALLVCLADEPIFTKTLPSKVPTYLAAGRPVVACLNGEGARVIQESGAGIAVHAGDAASLADAILQLADSSEAKREAMGDRARSHFEQHYAPGRVAEKLQDLIGQIIKMQR